LKLGDRIEDSEEQLFSYQRRDLPKLKYRVAKAVKEYKETPSICKGPKAEHQVILKLLEKCNALVIKGPEIHVDILALKVEGDHIKFPLKIVGVEAENFPLSSHAIKVSVSKLRGNEGPFFVIVVETSPWKYSYLVYTYPEMKQYVRDVKERSGGSYQFSVPRKTLKEDEKYKRYLEKWEKITDALNG